MQFNERMEWLVGLLTLVVGLAFGLLWYVQHEGPAAQVRAVFASMDTPQSLDTAQALIDAGTAIRVDWLKAAPRWYDHGVFPARATLESSLPASPQDDSAVTSAQRYRALARDQRLHRVRETLDFIVRREGYGWVVHGVPGTPDLLSQRLAAFRNHGVAGPVRFQSDLGPDPAALDMGGRRQFRTYLRQGPLSFLMAAFLLLSLVCGLAQQRLQPVLTGLLGALTLQLLLGFGLDLTPFFPSAVHFLN